MVGGVSRFCGGLRRAVAIWKWILGAGLLAFTKFKSIFAKKDKGI